MFLRDKEWRKRHFENQWRQLFATEQQTSIRSLKWWLELEPKELYELYPANARQRMELWVLIFLYGVPEHKTKAISGCLILPLW
jgi:hypothetical protein